MNYPSELRYSKSHEWVQEMGGGVVRVGITDFAQHALGDIVFVNLPTVGDDAVAGETVADVESVKAVSDIYSPVTGKVTAVNDALDDAPEAINEDPYGAWMIEVSEVTDTEELLSAGDYEELCKKEEE